MREPSPAGTTTSSRQDERPSLAATASDDDSEGDGAPRPSFVVEDSISPNLSSLLLLRRRLFEAVFERNQITERRLRDEVKRRLLFMGLSSSSSGAEAAPQPTSSPRASRPSVSASMSSSFRSSTGSNRSTTTTGVSTPSASLPPLILLSGPSQTGKSCVAHGALLQNLVETQFKGYLVRGTCQMAAISSNGSADGWSESAAASSPYPALVGALEELVAVARHRGPGEIEWIQAAVAEQCSSADEEVDPTVLTRVLPALAPLLPPSARPNSTQNLTSSSRRRRSDINFDPSSSSSAPWLQQGRDDDAVPPQHHPQSNGHSRPKNADGDIDVDFSVGRALECLLRAVGSRPDRPLVLIVDDLHNCDTPTIRLLSSLLTYREGKGPSMCPGLVVVATIQPDQVSNDAVLSSQLRELEDSYPIYSNSRIVNYEIHNYDVDELAGMLSQFFRIHDDKTHSLAAFVHSKSAGNPLHVAEFVSYLMDQQLISLEQPQHYESSVGWGGAGPTWSWDVHEMQVSVDAAISLEKLYKYKILRLPDPCGEALKVASCLGVAFDDKCLRCALGDRLTASSILEPAVSQGLIAVEAAVVAGPTTRYRFVNLHAYRAVLCLVPPEQRPELCAAVGRRLWKLLGTNDAAYNPYLPTVLSLFKLGKEYIQESTEREAVAELCYRAGFRAARASSFRTAATYFAFGIDVLGRDGWRQHYDLALSLSNAASEMCMCSGHFGEMHTHINSILQNARLYTDSVQARATRIYSYGMSDARQSDAVLEGLDVLQSLGVKLPRRPTRLRLGVEILRTRRLLSGKTDNFLLRLPTLRDPNKRSCLQVLSLVYQNALFARPDVVPFVILKMVELTIRHGMSEFAAVAFANFGMLCIRILGNVDMGYRYGSLGLRLVDRLESNELVPRVYATFYKHICVHKKPLRDTLSPLAKAYRIGLHTGDLEAAFLCALYFCMNSFDAGVRLPAIEREYSDIVRRMESSRQQSMLTTALPLLRWKRDLMGLSSDPLAPDGDLVNYDELKRTATAAGRPLVVSVVMTCQLIVAHVLNEYDFAASLLDEFVAKYLDVIPHGASKVGVTMTAGLCAIELARQIKYKKKRRHYVHIATKMSRRLIVAARQCPCNCLDKSYVVQAELASLRNDTIGAHQLFLVSIGVSESARSRYVCAKSNELMARHLLRIDAKDPEARRDSQRYFVESLRVYKDWGAEVKAMRLAKEILDLFPGVEVQEGDAIVGTVRRLTTRPSLLQVTNGSSTSTTGPDAHITPRPRLSLLRAPHVLSPSPSLGSPNS